jgi:ketosteroid isomerase-like protein
MSEEDVETLRKAYAAYNAIMSSPNPQEALPAVFDPFLDPEIEWVPEATGPEFQTFHGIDGVMEFFDLMFEGLEYARQVPERFIDCGDRVLVFVRTEARARTTGLETSEEWAHLITVRGGKMARVQQFRHRDEALEAAGLRE